MAGNAAPRNIQNIPDAERALCMKKGVDKLHIVYSATKIMQVTDAADEASTSVHKAPGNAVVCFALRTGFATSQGKLMRTILYSTQVSARVYSR